jgi:hypothetical protein
VEERLMASRRDSGISKLECLIQFDEVTYWLSRTRDLISSAETYSYPAFQESFRELRREARKSEFALVVALYKFERAMNSLGSVLKGERWDAHGWSFNPLRLPVCVLRGYPCERPHKVIFHRDLGLSLHGQNHGRYHGHLISIL